jgi:hypothetical protein
MRSKFSCSTRVSANHLAAIRAILIGIDRAKPSREVFVQNFFHMLNEGAVDGFVVRSEWSARAAGNPIEVQLKKFAFAKTSIESTFLNSRAEQRCVFRS